MFSIARLRAAPLALLLLSSAVAACESESKANDEDQTEDENSAAEESESDKDKEEGRGKQTEEKDPPAKDPKQDAGSGGSSKDAGKNQADPPKNNPDPIKSDAAAPPPAGNTGGPAGAMGPDDGDPTKPVVALQEVACGGPKGLGGGLGGIPVPATPNLKVGGRDVVLSYPCNKHEGANVTFILNLHGTMPDEGLKLYQHGYFSAHTLVSSHNLIVASPKSVVSQWGNGDNGVDRPHLMEVIKYVYDNFGSKYNITSMWVGGHSWGAMFAKTFVCDPELKDKVRGVIGMSGGAALPGGGLRGGGGMVTPNCSDYIGQIHTVGDMDSVKGNPDQSAAASKHGCGAKAAAKDLGNNQLVEEWPDCDPGWVHENITMGAHSHTTPINPEVVKHIVEKIKATEKR